MHLGAMAGTVDLMQRVSTGVEATGEALRFNPELPRELVRLDMRIRYRGHSIDLSLTPTSLTLRGRNPDAAPINVRVRDQTCVFASGSTQVFDLGTEPLASTV